MVRKISFPDSVVAYNLIRFREERGWSQEDLASRYGCTFQYISQLETGRRGFGADTFDKLAKVFGIEKRRLLDMPKGFDSKEIGEQWDQFTSLNQGKRSALFSRILKLLESDDPRTIKALESITDIIETQSK